MKRAIGDSVRVLLITALLIFGAVQVGTAATVKGTGTSPSMTPEIQSKIDALTRKRTELPAERAEAAAQMKLMSRVSGLFTSGLGQSVSAAALVTAIITDRGVFAPADVGRTL